jgi:hypothetical protein
MKVIGTAHPTQASGRLSLAALYPSNIANTGRRLPFPPRRKQRESLSSSLAAKAFFIFPIPKWPPRLAPLSLTRLEAAIQRVPNGAKLQ